MSGWLNNLKNLQGQLTDLASEVLSEATEEVADPESELQVTKRKCTELEEHLKEAEAKRQAADNRKVEVEEQLRAAHFEMDAIGTRYGSLIAARDDEIKKLKVQLEQTHASLHEDDIMDEEMREERIDSLKKEIAHWKSLVVQGGAPDANVEHIRRQKDQEMAALIQMHEEKLQELREHYEDKLAVHTGGAASSSESSEAMLDAVLLEKEELLEEKRKLEEIVARKLSEERAVMVDMGERDEGSTAGKLRQAEEELAELRAQIEVFAKKELDFESLRAQNTELATAYNDINMEMEEHKQREGRVNTRNHDLMVRIDALKADVIEYEERYELCKRENAETLKRLEKLTADFDRLKQGIAETKHRAETNDASMSGEVEKLRGALEQSKEDRDHLRADVDRFKGAIDSIDNELQLLRDSNNRLTAENSTLSDQLDQYDGSMKHVLERNENDLRAFRSEFEELQRMLKEKEEEFAERETQLKLQIHNLSIENAKLIEEHITQGAPMADVVEGSVSASNVRRELAAGTIDNEDPASLREQVDRLTCHLTEALGSITEMVQEGDGLRREKEECEKELNLRQSCIDDMIQQTSTLQAAQQAAAETVQALRKDVSDRDKLLRAAEVDFAHERERFEELATENTLLKERISEMVVKQAAVTGAEVDAETALSLSIMEKSEEIEKYKQRCDEAEARVEQLQLRVEQAEADLAASEARFATVEGQARQVAGLQNEEAMKRAEVEGQLTAVTEESQRLKAAVEEAEKRAAEAESRLAALAANTSAHSSASEAEAAQLRAIATQKHEESVAYYTQLQAASEELQRLRTDAATASAQADVLKNERERADKCQRELARLKEHLVMVEETSIVEAKEAEERETRLLEKVRTLEAAQTATLSTAEESTSNTQARIAALERSLAAAEADAATTHTTLERTERERAEAAAALASLQGVVRDLASEQDRDNAQAAHQAMQLSHQLKDMESLVEDLRGDCEKLSLDRQSAEDAAVMAREQMEAKQRVIEELEIRLEEAHTAASEKAHANSSQYRIDDVTLRQLFLSYFTAPGDRRPDIALLLASILEYPPEDMEKVRAAVRSGGGGNAVTSRSNAGGSLTEQFIRFLESESESARTAPQLPVKMERMKISGESDIGTRQSIPASESSSALIRDMLQDRQQQQAPPTLAPLTTVAPPLPESAATTASTPNATSSFAESSTAPSMTDTESSTA